MKSKDKYSVFQAKIENKKQKKTNSGNHKKINTIRLANIQVKHTINWFYSGTEYSLNYNSYDLNFHNICVNDWEA